MTAFLHSGGKNSHDRLSGRPHLSILLQWDLNCQDANFEGHIPIIHTVWIVGILTGLWTVPDFFQTSPIWKEGFTLLKKKKKNMILPPAPEMHQLFLRIPRHDSTSSVSSWASVLIHFSEVHETSLRWCLTLTHWPLRDIHPPPPHCYSLTFKEPITCGCQSGCCPLFKAKKSNHTTLPQERKQISFLSNGTKESELFVSPRWLGLSKGQLIWLCGAGPSKCQTANGKRQSEIHS